ncbi:MAG: acyl carrier protein [Isosphaeraceae bacterium]
MNTMANRVASLHFDKMDTISETIRSVSAKARGTTITTDSLLLEDLALDSLDLVAVILRLQDEFGVEIDPDEITILRSVGDLVASLDKHLSAAA